MEQYLDYINRMAVQDMEIAGEFLEMAAKLIYIKTVSLLPKHTEAEEMKKELEGRLIELSLCKKTAELMKQRYIGDAIYVRKPMKIDIDNTYKHIHNPEMLVDAYLGMALKKEDEKPVSANVFTKLVSKKFVSVTSQIVKILKRLYEHGEYQMNELFGGIQERSERVAAFLAVLELTKSGRILLNEDNSLITFNKENYRENDGSELENLEITSDLEDNNADEAER